MFPRVLIAVVPPVRFLGCSIRTIYDTRDRRQSKTTQEPTQKIAAITQDECERDLTDMVKVLA